MVDQGQLRQILASETRTAKSRDEDVLAAVRRLRRDLDDVVAAVEKGNRVPSGVTSDPFVASTAGDLIRTIHDRKAAYDVVARLGLLRDEEA